METELSIAAYRIFNIVAKSGNITKAARELYISQPAVSKAIAKLEHELSVPLFTRSSRGVRLTEEGKLLYEYTNDAFSKLTEGETALKRIHTLGIGHIRIGASTTLCKYILLPYLKEFITLYPHINFTIQCQSSFHTLELLSEGKIDIGLIGSPEKMTMVNFTPVNKIEDIFVATPAYLDNVKLREGRELTSEELFKAANLMLLDEKNITRQYIENYFRKTQITTGQVLEVSNMDLLIEFAKTGLGIACVIKAFVEDEINNKSLVQLTLKNKIKKREVGFAYMEKQPLTESVKKFIEFYLSMER